MKSLNNLSDAQIIKIAQEHKRKQKNGQIIIILCGAFLSIFSFWGAVLNDGVKLDEFDFAFTYVAPFFLGLFSMLFGIVCRIENK